MAKDLLTAKETTRLSGGLNPGSYTAASTNGHSVDNATQRIVLHIKNSNAGTIVVTVDTNITTDGLTLPDQTYSILTGEERFIGPFPNSTYAQDDTTDNSITQALWITFDTLPSVTIIALKIPSAT